jgi:hypothetical protein
MPRLAETKTVAEWLGDPIPVNHIRLDTGVGRLPGREVDVELAASLRL